MLAGTGVDARRLFDKAAPGHVECKVFIRQWKVNYGNLRAFAIFCAASICQKL